MNKGELNMIEVTGITKKYKNKVVLDKVSFTIEENEIFALLGPNGAGKTTTLECMEGLRGFDAGTIKLMGLTPKEALEKGVVGVQLQSSSLPDNISAKDAMTLFCKWKNINPRYDLLELFDLKETDKKQYKTMSTGQKRKLHLALALAQDPKILFLDEPTAGLDVEARVSLHQQIKKLKEQGVTIVLASHDMAEVEYLCDRVAILVEGKIRKIGKPSEIVLQAEEKTILKVRVDCDLDQFLFKHLQFHRNYNGYTYFKTSNSIDGLIELLQCIKENECKLYDLLIDKPSLEERFMDITKEERT